MRRVLPVALALLLALLHASPGPVLAPGVAAAAFFAETPSPSSDDGGRADEILALLLDLDLKRQAIAEQLQAGEAALRELQIEMAELRRKVRAGRADIERQRGEGGKRVAVLARMQPVDWLNILLGSESFAEFVGRWDAAQQLYARDRELLQQLQDARLRQQTYLAMLAARYERTEWRQLELLALERDAEATAAALEAELAALGGQRQTYEAQLAELEAEWQQALPGLQAAVSRLLALEQHFTAIDHDLALSLIPFGARVTVRAVAVDEYLADGGQSDWRIGFTEGKMTLTRADGRVVVGGPLHGDGDALVWTIADLAFAGVAIPPERQSAWLDERELRLRPAELPIAYRVDSVTATGDTLVLVLR